MHPDRVRSGTAVPDERRFYQAILSKVFAPFRPSRTAANLQFERVQLLASVGVRMLIVDEIQHVLAGPTLKQRHFLNVIKYLGNELQIPIVAVGTRDAFNASKWTRNWPTGLSPSYWVAGR